MLAFQEKTDLPYIYFYTLILIGEEILLMIYITLRHELRLCFFFQHFDISSYSFFLSFIQFLLQFLYDSWWVTQEKKVTATETIPFIQIVSVIYKNEINCFSCTWLGLIKITEKCVKLNHFNDSESQASLLISG